MKPTPQTEYPVIDGFMLDARLFCGLEFLSLALSEFESLRRAGSMRAKSWSVPPDNVTVIPARDSFEYQLYVKPGSAIWGYQFIAPAGFGFQLVNACDDVPLHSEVIDGPSEGTDETIQSPMPTLLIVSAPGLLNVTITSRHDATSGVQLILWGGEPV